ncbi:TetR/AcrR family transcriptional regulator [Paenibacillus sp. JX-17]|uniref:TetR/AcrR family transcriptional regulator n=1 Tax=Paenibacillus lacisoli TaxID=3064525 RepID=A0ABT9CAX4_9BACL|nr:TetR/AcrR family transcriptional regulator [Paenibacillus sp. JX-17]MDO7906409.1 TetR/AcrR family transcriptional regulator [Paenibacillus sp. JX-17]
MTRSHSSQPSRLPGRPKADAGAAPVNEQILIIASRMFMETGYEPISLQQIARACGVTKATIYYYFDGKSDLFTAAVTRMLQISRDMTQQFLRAPGPLRSRLEKIAEAKIRNSHADMDTMMRNSETFLSPEQRHTILEAEENIHRTLAESFDLAMQQGELRRGNPLMLAHAFSSLLMLGNRSIAREWHDSTEQLGQELVHLFLSGAGRH